MYVLNWLSIFFFFFFWLVVADFFCFKVGYTQCLAIATGNFFFFGFILMCYNLIALETKLLCLHGVIICDIKNKIRNNRQVPTYFMDLCSLQVFFLILFFYFLWINGFLWKKVISGEFVDEWRFFNQHVLFRYMNFVVPFLFFLKLWVSWIWYCGKVCRYICWEINKLLVSFSLF